VYYALGQGSSEIFVAFKALRLLRIIKLARSWELLQETLKKVYQSFIDIGYFSILVLLFMWIVALLGMELFAYTCFFDQYGNRVTDIQTHPDKENMLPPRLNFDNIG
jgi:hypothetical protein